MPSPIRTLALLSLASLACNGGPAAITAPKVVITPQGLEQTVQLTPATPSPGDNLSITSIVVNGTGAAVDVTSRICGMDLETTLKLNVTGLACAGYSMHGALAAGDTLFGFAGGVVVSGAGTYTVRVRHLLNPDVWVEVPVTVVGPLGTP